VDSAESGDNAVPIVEKAKPDPALDEESGKHPAEDTTGQYGNAAQNTPPATIWDGLDVFCGRVSSLLEDVRSEGKTGSHARRENQEH